MIRLLRISIAVLTAGFIVSGCVSSGTFNKMEKAKNDEIAALQQEKAALGQQKINLEKQNADLKQQVSSLEQQKVVLDQEKAALQQEKAATQQQVGSLEQEKASLMASNQQRQKQYEELVQGLSKEVEKGQLQVKQYKNMLSVDLAEQIFFDSGKATLKREGKEVLKKVGDALKGYENKIIRVVGHTDNVPVAKSLQATFPSNWELSVARATNVVRFLQEVGVPPERMIASGRAEYDPVATNETPEGRQKNRRIEIMLIDKNLESEMTKTGS
ncbi:MAG TPA: OmpA family protein [Nitrospirota bacterium]|nr:OmpA family protein [Nitrospirota bacterium]